MVTGNFVKGAVADELSFNIKVMAALTSHNKLVMWA
jgi:hypothetical protein